MQTQNRASTLIQSTWRGWRCRRRWPIVRQGRQIKHQQSQMPPPVPPPNFVPAIPTSLPKSNGLMTAARSTSHHESMGHAIITSTSFLNTVSHPMTNVPNHTNISRGSTSASLPHLQQQQIMSSHHFQPNHNETTQQSGKGFKVGLDTALSMATHLENGIPVPAPRAGSMGPQLPPPTGPTNLITAKSVPNIASSRSNSNASGAAISPVSGGEGSCNSSNSPGGGLGYPHSNPPGSVCSNASTANGGRPRPQPIAGTPPPDVMDRCDSKLVQQTCNMFGLDMVGYNELISTNYISHR